MGRLFLINVRNALRKVGIVKKLHNTRVCTFRLNLKRVTTVTSLPASRITSLVFCFFKAYECSYEPWRTINVGRVARIEASSKSCFWGRDIDLVRGGSRNNPLPLPGVAVFFFAERLGTEQYALLLDGCLFFTKRYPPSVEPSVATLVRQHKSKITRG